MSLEDHHASRTKYISINIKHTIIIISVMRHVDQLVCSASAGATWINAAAVMPIFRRQVPDDLPGRDRGA